MPENRPVTEIAISGDPQDCILAILRLTEEICNAAGKDSAEGTMMLLSAGVLLAKLSAGKSAKALTDMLADALGNAIIIADDWFKR